MSAPTQETHDLATAPSWAWDQITEALCRAMSLGFDAGYAQGRRDAAQDAEDAAVWSQAAQVARNVANDRTRTWAPAGAPQRRGWAS